MKVTILNTQTGRSLEVDKPFNGFWWAEGNGSCDCNRAIFVGVNTGKPEEICQGCKRFLIVAAEDQSYTIQEYNAGYPKTLLDKHNVLE